MRPAAANDWEAPTLGRQRPTDAAGSNAFLWKGEGRRSAGGGPRNPALARCWPPSAPGRRNEAGAFGGFHPSPIEGPPADFAAGAVQPPAPEKLEKLHFT